MNRTSMKPNAKQHRTQETCFQPPVVARETRGGIFSRKNSDYCIQELSARQMIPGNNSFLFFEKIIACPPVGKRSWDFLNQFLELVPLAFWRARNCNFFTTQIFHFLNSFSGIATIFSTLYSCFWNSHFLFSPNLLWEIEKLPFQEQWLWKYVSHICVERNRLCCCNSDKIKWVPIDFTFGIPPNLLLTNWTMTQVLWPSAPGYCEKTWLYFWPHEADITDRQLILTDRQFTQVDNSHRWTTHSDRHPHL